MRTYPLNITFYEDSTGRDMVLIPLANSERAAIVTVEDWKRISAAGISDFWFINHVRQYSYVRAISRRTGNLESIARFVAGVGRGQRVHTKDGDCCNLTPENLTVRQGWAKMECAPELVAAALADDRNCLAELVGDASHTRRAKAPRDCPRATYGVYSKPPQGAAQAAASA